MFNPASCRAGWQPTQLNREILLQLRCTCGDARPETQLARALGVERIDGAFQLMPIKAERPLENSIKFCDNYRQINAFPR